jgi:multidrug efflux pump subunit AcrA (membrane-fusion protein)
MKRNMFLTWLPGSLSAIAALVFALLLTGCEEPFSPTVDPALTGTVRITGTVKVGETLTADTGSLGGEGDISYQWIQIGHIEAKISGATASNYQLVEADKGAAIKVQVRNYR